MVISGLVTSKSAIAPEPEIVKVFETEDALRNGADEIDMVLNAGKLKDGEFKETKMPDGTIKEFTLENFGNFTNPNTDPTKISPGNKGYTDIVIDPTLQSCYND